MRVATIDLGTNTFLLLIAERVDGIVQPVYQEEAFVRLGQGVDKSGVISQEAMARGLASLGHYRDVTADYRCEKITACGTSALRDAKNSREFIELVEAELDLQIRIISGEEEAQLSFIGALSNKKDLETPIFMLDIGGGSTELCWGAPEEMLGRFSLNIGSVRLTERYFQHDPPTPVELTAFRATVWDVWQAHTQAASIDLRNGTLVGVDGTVTTFAMIHNKMIVYDCERIDGAVLQLNEIKKLTALLVAKTTMERKTIVGLSPKRADVILAGALILEWIMELGRADRIVVSDRGLRFGMAQEAYIVNNL